MSSNSNSLTNVMTTCDTKPPGTGNMSGEEYHPLNGCKSLNGISSLVGEVLKQGSNNVNNEQQQQQSSNKSLGINGTEISPSWKNFAVSNLANNNNMTNNNISNSSGENSTTSLNEMGRVSKTAFYFRWSDIYYYTVSWRFEFIMFLYLWFICLENQLGKPTKPH